MTSAAKSVSKLKAAQMDAFSLSGAHELPVPPA